MDSFNVDAVFSQLDQLESDKKSAKVFTDDELNTLEVPFQLLSHGREAGMDIILDSTSKGIDMGKGNVPFSAEVPWDVVNLVSVDDYLDHHYLSTRSSHALDYMPPCYWKPFQNVFGDELFHLESSMPQVDIKLVRDTYGSFAGQVTAFEEILEAGPVTVPPLQPVGEAPTATQNRLAAASPVRENLPISFDFLTDDTLLLSHPPNFMSDEPAAIDESSDATLLNVYQVGANPAQFLEPFHTLDQEDKSAAEALRFSNIASAQNLDEKRAQGLSMVKNDMLFEDDDAFLANMSKIGGSSLVGESSGSSSSSSSSNSSSSSSSSRSSSSSSDIGINSSTNIDNSCSSLSTGPSIKDDTNKVANWAVIERISVANFHQEVPHMALQYPFPLDIFQKEAVIHLEKGESVLVAAHTSAGKTVVAEYAIALANQHRTRAVYTSPIKTLSNQKFREFRKKFGEENVGIMTGDVAINPEAPCLILTTEILRSMLYRGADLIRNMEWVIFDEVHYINDPERGVVWEEVIIMLPPHVNIILLSATVPNTQEFADWVGRTKQKKIFVVSTTKRPVPLKHYLWTHDKMFNIVDEDSKWREQGFKDAREACVEKKVVNPSSRGASNAERGGGERASRGVHRGARGGGPSTMMRRFNPFAGMRNLIKFLERQQLLPVVVFAFSKRKCQEFADGLGLDLTTNQEKSDTHRFVRAAISRLQGSDRTLPQVTRIAALVKRGIGVHHSGMLPILKEVVEMLFSRGSVKVLFATETFAMGVNMPTRTVIFEGITKHDGQSRRTLTPGEYTQMAGRAGRRGLDGFGIVAVFCKGDEIPEELTCKTLILGKSTKLTSRFRLTYNMILNLLRLEDLGVEDMIKRSFLEVWSQKSVFEQQSMKVKIEARLRALPQVDCLYNIPESIEDYYNVHARNAAILAKKIAIAVASPEKFLPPGQLVLVKKFGLRGVLGCVVDSASLHNKSEGHQDPRKLLRVVLLLGASAVPRKVRQLSESKDNSVVLGEIGDSAYVLLSVLESDLQCVGKDKVVIDSISIKDGKQRAIAAVVIALQEKIRSYRGNAVTIHINSDSQCLSEDQFPLMDISSGKDLASADDRIQFARNSKLLSENKCHDCPRKQEHFALMEAKNVLESSLSKLQFSLSDQNVSLIKEFELRLGVLQKLQYIDAGRAVQVKGRAACEVNTCDSLIVTELIFENVLTNLSPEEAVSLLSCLICQHKTEESVAFELPAALEKARDKLLDIALSLGNLQLKHGIDVVPTDYVTQTVNPALMGVVYEWARGTSFATICDSTDIEEGSIVRSITRLEETCREVRNAARVIGNPKLFQDMLAASELIKRDIVFAGSLYLT